MAVLALAHDSGNAVGIEDPVTPAPEYPMVYLPEILMIGILAAIVMIKITCGEYLLLFSYPVITCFPAFLVTERCSGRDPVDCHPVIPAGGSRNRIVRRKKPLE